jgi:hypothetical protein
MPVGFFSNILSSNLFEIYFERFALSFDANVRRAFSRFFGKAPMLSTSLNQLAIGNSIQLICASSKGGLYGIISGDTLFVGALGAEW